MWTGWTPTVRVSEGFFSIAVDLETVTAGSNMFTLTWVTRVSPKASGIWFLSASLHLCLACRFSNARMTLMWLPRSALVNGPTRILSDGPRQLGIGHQNAEILRRGR